MRRRYAARALTLAASKHGLSMNYTTDFKSMRAEVSAEEWQARVDLAARRVPQAFGRVVSPSN